MLRIDAKRCISFYVLQVPFLEDSRNSSNSIKRCYADVLPYTSMKCPLLNLSYNKDFDKKSNCTVGLNKWLVLTGIFRNEHCL